jgi:hypothetical protein
MSPENQQPNSPQGIKDLINTSTHPEGVREFKSGDLPDVADDLTRHNDASAIDPETRDVTFDKIELKPDDDVPETETTDSLGQNSGVDIVAPDIQPVAPITIETPQPAEAIPVTKEKVPAWKKWVAALAGTAAVGSLGYGASKALGNDHDATPVPTTPTASAPVVPGATETGSAIGENEGAGLEDQTQSPESTPATPEVESALAKYGLSVEAYPDFKSLASAYYEKYMDYRASGTVSGEPGDPQYLEALYGKDWSNGRMAPYVQDVINNSINVINRHIATGENGDPEYQETLTVTDISDISEAPDKSTASGIVTFHYTTNAGETVLKNLPGATSEDTYGKFRLEFTNTDGYWQLTAANNLNQ